MSWLVQAVARAATSARLLGDDHRATVAINERLAQAYRARRTGPGQRSTAG